MTKTPDTPSIATTGVNPVRKTFWLRIRGAILTGIFVVVPIFFSLWVGWIIYESLTSWGVALSNLLPKSRFLTDFWRMQLIRILSFCAMILVLIFIGLLTKLALGQRLIRAAQRILLKVPIINFIYSTCKQIGDAVWNSSGGNMFHQVVLLEFPRRGAWTVAFLTNENETDFEVTEKLRSRLLSVYVPTTPNPTSGYLLFVPREDCVFLDMSVADAMKLIVSCGGVIPPETAEKLSSDD